MLATEQPTALRLDLTAVQLAPKLCKQRYKQHKLEDVKLRQEFAKPSNSVPLLKHKKTLPKALSNQEHVFQDTEGSSKEHKSHHHLR
jgi:hypothetical protein